MMVPAVHTCAYRLWRAGKSREASDARKALRPPPKYRNEIVLSLWRSGLFDTVEIAARTGLLEEDVDRIISADMDARHG